MLTMDIFREAAICFIIGVPTTILLFGIGYLKLVMINKNDRRDAYKKFFKRCEFEYIEELLHLYYTRNDELWGALQDLQRIRRLFVKYDTMLRNGFHIDGVKRRRIRVIQSYIPTYIKRARDGFKNHPCAISENKLANYLASIESVVDSVRMYQDDVPIDSAIWEGPGRGYYEPNT